MIAELLEQADCSVKLLTEDGSVGRLAEQQSWAGQHIRLPAELLVEALRAELLVKAR